jgi:hypothetical protein
MPSLLPGDRIEISFIDVPRQVEYATVSSALTDQQEGLGPEIEDYIACWLEVRADDCSSGKRRSISMGTDLQYSMDGHRITVRKL